MYLGTIYIHVRVSCPEPLVPISPTYVYTAGTYRSIDIFFAYLKRDYRSRMPRPNKTS